VHRTNADGNRPKRTSRIVISAACAGTRVAERRAHGGGMLSAMVVDPTKLSGGKIRPLSRREYERMVELGFFDEDERIELLEGVLVQMSPQGWHHMAVTQRLAKLLYRAVDDSLIVRTQMPFAATDYSEPEPDISVVVDDETTREHPKRALLIIEVANDSLDTDLNRKRAAYARARVPEYWVVDLERMVVHVFIKPVRGRYMRKQLLREGDVLRPTKLPGVEIPVSKLPR
jgi:Uma2 family endonuclease